MNYSFHVWSHEDRATAARLVELLNLVFGARSFDLPMFVWKHARNPLGPSIVTYALRSASDQPVAVRALWRCQLTIGGDSCVAFQPCDTATHPDHQRRGLFSRITDHAVAEAAGQGAAACFNFPNARSGPGYAKLGWLPMGSMLLLGRPVRALRGGIRLVTGTWRRDSPRCSVDGPDSDRGSLDNDIRRLASLVTPLSTHIQGARSDAFLNWRIARHPRFRYTVACSGACGVVFRHRWRRRLREVAVEDLLGAPDARSLHEALLLSARTADADIATVCISQAHPFIPLLKRMGFVRLHGERHLVVRSIVPGALADLTPENWALTGLDIDTN